jgi:hypothetical protein
MKTSYTGFFLNKLHVITVLHLMETGVLLASECMRILLMCQHANTIWTEGNFLPLFTDHTKCWKCCPHTHKYILQLTVLLKKTEVQQSFLHLQHTRHQLSLDGLSNCVAILALVFDTLVSWARCVSDFLGIWSRLTPLSSNFSSVSSRRLCFFIVY